MNYAIRPACSTVAAFVAILALAVPASTMAQEAPPPQPSSLECASGSSQQLLSATPIDDGSRTLILARGILEPGGHIGAHRNLVAVTVAIESGSLGFTLLDGDVEMTITRAATADTEATGETVAVGEEVRRNPGDSLAPPPGTTDAGRNLSDGETTALIAAIIEPGQPPEECVDAVTPDA